MDVLAQYFQRSACKESLSKSFMGRLTNPNYVKLDIHPHCSANNNLTSDLCIKGLQLIDNMLIDTGVMTEDHPFGCGLCYKSFKTNKSVSIHLKKKHSIIKEEIIPEIPEVSVEIETCTASTSLDHKASILNNEILSSSEQMDDQASSRQKSNENASPSKKKPKDYVCPICEHRFSSDQKLENHIKNIHGLERRKKKSKMKNKCKKQPDIRTNRVCSICNKVYTSTRKLKSHVERKHKSKSDSDDEVTIIEYDDIHDSDTKNKVNIDDTLPSNLTVVESAKPVENSKVDNKKILETPEKTPNPPEKTLKPPEKTPKPPEISSNSTDGALSQKRKNSVSEVDESISVVIPTKKQNADDSANRATLVSYCHLCSREFQSEKALMQHNDAKHSNSRSSVPKERKNSRNRVLNSRENRNFQRSPSAFSAGTSRPMFMPTPWPEPNNEWRYSKVNCQVEHSQLFRQNSTFSAPYHYPYNGDLRNVAQENRLYVCSICSEKFVLKRNLEKHYFQHSYQRMSYTNF